MRETTGLYLVQRQVSDRVTFVVVRQLSGRWSVAVTVAVAVQWCSTRRRRHRRAVAHTPHTDARSNTISFRSSFSYYFAQSISTPSNTPIPWPTALTTPNGIRIQSVVFPQFIHQTDRPTDRQTDQATDGLGDNL